MAFCTNNTRKSPFMPQLRSKPLQPLSPPRLSPERGAGRLGKASPIGIATTYLCIVRLYSANSHMVRSVMSRI